TGDRSQQLRSGVQNPRNSFEREANLGSNLAHNGSWDKEAMNWGAYFSTLTLNDVKRKDMWEKPTVDLSDPMSKILESKRERARLATQCFPKAKKLKLSYYSHLEWSPVHTSIFQIGSLGPQVLFEGLWAFLSQAVQTTPQFLQHWQSFSPNAALPSLGQQEIVNYTWEVLKLAEEGP
ncbi:18624_t:CDS:2, partial [Racocetra persica]